MKICMISYSVYEYDNRVHRYGSSLVESGHEVDVLCLGREKTGEKIYHDANIFQIQCRKMNEKSAISYLLKIIVFFIKVFFKLGVLHIKKRYDVIHFHNIPDFGIFTTIIPKLMGARIIFDIHDLVPEFYARKFNLPDTHLIVKSLKLIEKMACKYAHHVITVTDIWKKKLTDRSVPIDKCTVILNAPYPGLFDSSKKSGQVDNNNFTILYHGALNEHFGVDIAIKAIGLIKDEIPDNCFHIYGRGREEENLLILISKHNLEKKVIMHKPVPRDAIPNLIAQTTIGVVPKRSAQFADEALSSKLLEFAYMQKPVIVSRTKASTNYFNDKMVLFFEPEDEKGLAAGILKLYKQPELRKQLIENIDIFNQQHNWNEYFIRYIGVLKNL